MTCLYHDTAYALANGDEQLLNEADSVFFESNFGEDFTSSAYAVAVKYGNQLNRKIFAIPFGIAALGYGITASKLPSKSKLESNDDNYLAFRPRTNQDFVDQSSRSVYRPNLRGSVQQTSSIPESDIDPSVPYTGPYNPYSTGLYNRRVRRNRRKRRNPTYF